MRCKKRNCVYRKNLGSVYGEYCDYCGETGRPRGCPPEVCNKYKPGRETRERKGIEFGGCDYEKKSIGKLAGAEK